MQKNILVLLIGFFIFLPLFADPLKTGDAAILLGGSPLSGTFKKVTIQSVYGEYAFVSESVGNPVPLDSLVKPIADSCAHDVCIGDSLEFEYESNSMDIGGSVHFQGKKLHQGRVVILLEEGLVGVQFQPIKGETDTMPLIFDSQTNRWRPIAPVEKLPTNSLNLRVINLKAIADEVGREFYLTVDSRYEVKNWTGFILRHYNALLQAKMRVTAISPKLQVQLLEVNGKSIDSLKGREKKESQNLAERINHFGYNVMIIGNVVRKGVWEDTADGFKPGDEVLSVISGQWDPRNEKNRYIVEPDIKKYQAQSEKVKATFNVYDFTEALLSRYWFLDRFAKGKVIKTEQDKTLIQINYETDMYTSSEEHYKLGIQIWVLNSSLIKKQM